MKKLTTAIIAGFVTSVLCVGCASTKGSEAKVDTTESQMEVKGKNSVIVDWADRNVDSPAKPEWLKKLVKGNSDVFKTEFGIDKSYIIKLSSDSARAKELAKTASRVSYYAVRAEELRNKVVSEAARTLDDKEEVDALTNAAMRATANISGHELVTQFWQEIETIDPETELKTKEFICYSVYKISRENWMETLKAYMKDVLPSVPTPESKKKMAATIASLYEDTTKEVEKTEAETLAEIKAKKDAIKTSSKTADYPAPKESDLEWLDVLETACNILF